MTEPLYAIKNWPTLYENNRTREMKRMGWVPVPNRMDGDGYTELVQHPDGAGHFGVWVALLQIASRCNPRGSLVRDNGRPHTPQSLARISHLPAELFSTALPRLVEIGWVSISESNDSTYKKPHLPAEFPQAPAVFPHPTDQEQKEQNRTEGSERNGTERPSPAAFPDENEKRLAYIRASLENYPKPNRPPGKPDAQILEKTIRATEGASLERIGDVLRRLHDRGAKPESWAFFPEVLRRELSNGLRPCGRKRREGGDHESRAGV